MYTSYMCKLLNLYEDFPKSLFWIKFLKATGLSIGSYEPKNSVHLSLGNRYTQHINQIPFIYKNR